jgi:hypothetical protein
MTISIFYENRSAHSDPLFDAETVKLVAWAKNPNHTGEQSYQSRGGVGFL